MSAEGAFGALVFGPRQCGFERRVDPVACLIALAKMELGDVLGPVERDQADAVADARATKPVEYCLAAAVGLNQDVDRIEPVEVGCVALF
jgi:hypothetical protein